MLRLYCLHLLLMTFDKVLRPLKQLLTTVKIEFFTFNLHSSFYLFLQAFGVFVESCLSKVIGPLSHFYDTGGVVQTRALNCTLFYGDTEVVKLFLLLLLELHLYKCRFILVLRQDDIVPFVL